MKTIKCLRINYKNIGKKLFFIGWIFVIVFTFALFPLSNEPDGNFRDINLDETLDNWKNDGKTVDLPAKFPDSKEEIELENKLPKKIKDNTSIMLKSLNNEVSVYVDGEEIYSYGKIHALPYGHMTGNIFLVVPILKEYAGKNIKIRYSVHRCNKWLRKKTLNLSRIYIGDKYRFNLYILDRNMWKLGLAVIIFTLSFLSVCFVLYQVFLGVYHSNIKGFLYFSGMCFMLLQAIVANSELLQFVTDKYEAYTFLGYISTLIIGILYIGCCKNILKVGRKIWNRLELIGTCLLILAIILYAFNICDIVEIANVMYGYILLTGIASFYYAIKEWRYGSYSKVMIIGLSFVGLTFSIGIALYLFAKEENMRTYTAFLSIALISYIMIILSIMILKEVRFIEERFSVGLYKSMAYIDKLTKCGNRTALEMEFENVINKKNHKNILYVLVDLNHLKKVNDNYGHDAGDELICGGAECIKKGFAPEGDVYRLGGDEFAIIIWDCQKDISDYYKKLDEEIKKYNKSNRYQVSMAKGYVKKDITNDTDFFRNLYLEVDKNMYVDKERCHKLLKDEMIVNENIEL